MGSAYHDQEPASPRDRSNSSSSSSYSSSSASFEAAGQQGLDSKGGALASSRSQDSLHNMLLDALRAGNLEIARHLLSTGAPILRNTPTCILSAPPAQQIPLFELFTQYGWTPNTPGFYGAVLLPKVVTNLPLLQWFLEHGADPNLGKQRNHRDRMGTSDTDSCAALATAAAAGSLEAVRLLLDAGAQVQNGAPLHSAAGACPPGTPAGAQLNAGVISSQVFDTSRIPVMALLVDHGADINQAEDSHYVLAQYPIVYAAMAGAVERVKWLLAHGADPEAQGGFGSAIDYAKWRGSTEMKRVLGIPVDTL
ncbi:Ankyrin repeat and KH domain-containing protein [Lachnellula subtilissima]|uniref:Ankyrin repeat and KH domain-containing protein n=1 Tax=Lachnellula subtilissima TaxID=602034 RepID=A0A8H8S107_9HELO|nr:Ankyrin repeat and KH domain-containing protein [Lachnellula subtilissima]